MPSEKKIKGLVEYWLANSTEKLKTMKSLYENKRYSDCLFFSHMVLEMILKAHAVKKMGKQVPKTHNLRNLAEMAELDLDKEETKLIVKTNEFNMEARYPSEKLEFYKLCTKEYTDEFYQPILNLYKKLCQKIK